MTLSAQCAHNSRGILTLLFVKQIFPCGLLTCPDQDTAVFRKKPHQIPYPVRAFRNVQFSGSIIRESQCSLFLCEFHGSGPVTKCAVFVSPPLSIHYAVIWFEAIRFFR